MSCGDAANSWVPTLAPSVWTGTVGTDSLVAVFTTALHAAAIVIGGVAGVGTWSKDSEGFKFTAALEGITWHVTVHADACAVGGDVTAAAGTALDGNSQSYAVAMTRTV